MRRICVVAVTAFLLALPAFASEPVPPAFGVSPDQPRVFTAPPMMTKALAMKPDAELPAMSAADLAYLHDKNGTNAQFVRIGLVRQLVSPLSSADQVSLFASSEKKWHWSANVSVPTADRLRLRLSFTDTPRSATFWVYGRDGRPFGFDASTAYDHELWTPVVSGDRIWIEAAGDTPASFSVDAVADIRRPSEIFATGTECLQDVMCSNDSAIQKAATSVALYLFTSGTDIGQCSGALISDRADTFTPYFLTANHCVSTQTEASSVMALWDYRSTSCGGPAPDVKTLPTTFGATLLTTSPATDVTLLRLSDVPGSRRYMGWDPRTLSQATVINRISHPGSDKQHLSTTTVQTSGPTCTASPRPQFTYSTYLAGDTIGGSSGAPAWYGPGYVIGQLLGKCGARPGETCDVNNLTIDGSFAASYPLLKPYIDPDTSPACAACTPSSETACILGGRFKVTLNWTNRFATPATSGKGNIIKYAENKMVSNPTYGPMSEVVYFSMFDATSVESIVRIVNGVGINDKYWVYATGFANVEYTVTVVDTKTCRTWTRTNPNGTFGMITDQAAFPLN